MHGFRCWTLLSVAVHHSTAAAWLATPHCAHYAKMGDFSHFAIISSMTVGDDADSSDSSERVAGWQRWAGEPGIAALLAYSSISAVWYLAGVTVCMWRPATIGGGLRQVIRRLSMAWVMTFAASQVTTPWRAAGAVALTPLYTRLLATVRRRLRLRSVWFPAGACFVLIATTFCLGMALLGARDLSISLIAG